MGALTKCKTCGKEVAKSAKTCPGCGAKLKTGLFAKLVLTVFLMVALMVVGITLTRKSPEDRAEKTAAVLQDLSKMTPVTVDFASASLEAQIKEKKGSAILVTTIIQKVEKLKNRYKISSMLGGAGMNVKGVFFYLYPKTPQDDQTIAGLKTMDEIRIKGIISGTMIGNIVLDPAILASDSPAPVSAQAPPAVPAPQPVPAPAISATSPSTAAAPATSPSTTAAPAETSDIPPGGGVKSDDYSHQSDPVAEAEAEYKRADAELNKVWKQIMRKLDQTAKKSIREQQRAWIKSRDAACQNMPMTQHYDCLETQTRTRIDLLRKL